MSGIVLLALALFIFPVVYPRWAAWQQRRRFALDIANVELIQGPRLICSEWEGDNTVDARAAALRGLLGLSKNQWITPDQIIVRKFHPHCGDGKTRLTFENWRALVEREFDTISARFYAETQARGNGQFESALHGQRPPEQNGQNGNTISW